MDIFSGAIAGLGTAAWSRAILPPQGAVGIPSQGTVTIPDQGLVNIPDPGAVNIPVMGQVNIPAMGQVGIQNPGPFGFPSLGGMWGTYGPTTGWGSNVGRITGSLTGFCFGGVQHPTCGTSFSTQPVQMPTGLNNPFASFAPPNPFFTAQLYGGGSGFYAGFFNAFSGLGFV